MHNNSKHIKYSEGTLKQPTYSYMILLSNKTRVVTVLKI